MVICHLYSWLWFDIWNERAVKGLYLVLFRNNEVTYIQSLYYRLLINSLGPKFSSQGHFHSLQLLNIPQFLFSRLVRLKTAPRGNFSHA